MAIIKIKEEFINKIIIPRKKDSRKGQNGVIGVIGGSRLYHGAPALSAIASLRSGIDLAYVFAPKIISDSLRAISPDLIIYPLPDSKLTIGNVNKILHSNLKIDTFVIGPGMSKQNMKGLIKLCNELISKNINIVLDADAINLDLIKTLNRDSYSDIGQVVLTPHLGEFERISRMRPKSESEKIDAVKNFAEKYHLTILLKGKIDYITNGKLIAENLTGNAAMTKGGTGDILSGMVGAHMALGYSAFYAACISAYVLGKTGDKTYDKYGFQMLGSDILNELPETMLKYNKII